MYTLDTNAVIYYFKGEVDTKRILEEIFTAGHPPYISVITELELFSFPNMSVDEVARIEGLLASAIIMSVDSGIARLAGALKQKYHLKVPDSAIAATALFTNTQLVTRNVYDFKKIQEITLYPI